MNRKQRRMFTASAAASLVLTVGPALVSPAGAAASGATGLLAPARASLLTSSVALSRSAFRQTLRAARTELRQARSSATAKYRSSVSPLHYAMHQELAQAPSKATVRQLRESYGEATLTHTIECDRELSDAHKRYALRVEQARVAYLRAVGAQPTVVANARARTATHAATATYQAAVQRARSIHRSVTAPSRATLRAALSRAGSVNDTGIARVEAQRSYREATADATAFFRASLGLAREEYRKELVGAKSDYRAATSVASVEAA
ncbi:MAG: hypothetical protein WAV88_02805 [Candidatus Nanopelagicales bacterium]